MKKCHDKVGFYFVNTKLIYSETNVIHYIEQVKKKNVIISINIGKVLEVKTHSLFKQRRYLQFIYPAWIQYIKAFTNQ